MKKHIKRRRGLTKRQRKNKKSIKLKNKRLVKKYYWLMPTNWEGKVDKYFKDYHYIEWGWSPGWDKAFGQMYMDELGRAIRESGQKNFKIYQIKEKYGCYDDKTEVLTKDGWKYFKDLSYEDYIATLNSETNYLEYQKPLEIIAEKYNGKMYRLENRGVSLCVTPNHNLFVAKGSYFNGLKNNFKRQYDFELCTPDKYFNKDKRFLKTCLWNGELDYEQYKIKGIEYDSLCHANDINSSNRHYIKSDLSFELIPWLRFLGFYIAEGYVDNKKSIKRRGEIGISFNPYDEEKLVKELIKGIGFEPNINLEKKAAKFYDITLGEWLIENCGHGAINKKVPNFIKELPPKYIKEFLTYLFIGDGHKTDTSNILTTISKQLSNDVQELLLKAGYCFRETIRDRVGHLGGFSEKNKNGDLCEIITKHITYEINWLKLPDIEIDMSKAKRTKSFQEDWINYCGSVYCVTVPNHIIYIRRNGKGLWCGNSARLYCSGTCDKVHDIISKYEMISENVCYYCGKEAPMTDGGWVLPQCFECFCKVHRRRERYSMKNLPKTDEELRELYNKIIIDKPDEHGEYHMTESYTVRRFSKDGNKDVVYNITDTVNKIRERQKKWCKKTL